MNEGTLEARMTAEITICELLRLLEARAPDAPRLVSLFGRRQGDRKYLHYILDLPDVGYREFEYPVVGPIPSATPSTPAAAWHERELYEEFGVEFIGHPGLLPLRRHGSRKRETPQSSSGRSSGGRPSEFLEVQGAGVCEVPVGPVHAGVIEPGHFRFSVIGDSVLRLDLRLFYTHKGTEKLFEGSLATDAVPIAESVSGDNCFAHAVAYCMALEGVLAVHVPRRAEAIRLIGSEMERLWSHIVDFGALCGDVGFSVPAAYCARIKEDLLQASTRFAGTRYWRAVGIPGGVTCDPTQSAVQELSRAVGDATADFALIARTALETPSVQDRFEAAGILEANVARDFGVVGPAARGSGIKKDVRADHPYSGYGDFQLEVPCYHYGDVMARARVRVDEAMSAARLIVEQLACLPSGDIRVPVGLSGSGKGFAAVEAPRGELLYWLEVNQGRIARCHVRSPSFQNWPALPFAVAGNIIADFPLINKSFNLSYSGCDR
jgi:hydrogenase-4 component G